MDINSHYGWANFGLWTDSFITHSTAFRLGSLLYESLASSSFLARANVCVAVLLHFSISSMYSVLSAYVCWNLWKKIKRQQREVALGKSEKMKLNYEISSNVSTLTDINRRLVCIRFLRVRDYMLMMVKKSWNLIEKKKHVVEGNVARASQSHFGDFFSLMRWIFHFSTYDDAAVSLSELSILIGNLLLKMEEERRVFFFHLFISTSSMFELVGCIE